MPLILLPGAGGNGLALRHVSDSVPHWVAPITVHRSLDQKAERASPDSIRGIAVRIADEYVARQLTFVRTDNEPVAIFGWCFGGLVAIELSEVLASRGVPTAALFAAETKAPSTLLHSAASKKQSQTRRADAGLEYSWQSFVRTIKRKYGLYRHKPRFWINLFMRTHDFARTTERELVLRDSLLEAKYRRGPYSGNVMLIWTRWDAEKAKLSRLPWSYDFRREVPRWSRVAASVELEFVSGDHYSMLQQPGASEIVNLIVARLLLAI